jgi:hypothetical protein
MQVYRTCFKRKVQLGEYYRGEEIRARTHACHNKTLHADINTVEGMRCLRAMHDEALVVWPSEVVI